MIRRFPCACRFSGPSCFSSRAARAAAVPGQPPRPLTPATRSWRKAAGPRAPPRRTAPRARAARLRPQRGALLPVLLAHRLRDVRELSGNRERRHRLHGSRLYRQGQRRRHVARRGRHVADPHPDVSAGRGPRPGAAVLLSTPRPIGCSSPPATPEAASTSRGATTPARRGATSSSRPTRRTGSRSTQDRPWRGRVRPPDTRTSSTRRRRAPSRRQPAGCCRLPITRPCTGPSTAAPRGHRWAAPA